MKFDEIELNPNIKKYSDELSEDVKLTHENIMDKSLLVSSIWAKWLSYLYLEKDNLEKLTNLKQRLTKATLDNISHSDSILRMKSEKMLEQSDEKIQKVNALTKQTQNAIDFIERALGILSNFGFTVKNSLDAIKLQMQ